MNKEDASTTPAPAATAPTTETETEKIQPVTGVSLPISEGQTAPTGVMDPGTQPQGHYTIFTDFNEAETSDEEPFQSRKRNRNTTNVDYLADLENGADSNEPKKPGWTLKGTQGPTWKGHEVKHGVPIGVWTLSDEPVDDQKNVIYGFLDQKSELHGRKYPER